MPRTKLPRRVHTSAKEDFKADTLRPDAVWRELKQWGQEPHSVLQGLLCLHKSLPEWIGVFLLFLTICTFSITFTCLESLLFVSLGFFHLLLFSFGLLQGLLPFSSI